MTFYEDLRDIDRVLFNRIAIAVPEVNFDEDYVDWGVRMGWVRPEEARNWKSWIGTAKKGKRLGMKLTRGTFMERISSLMPEIFSVRTIDWLRKLEIDGSPILTSQEANILRSVLGAAKVLEPVFVAETTLLKRIEAVYGTLTSGHLINTIRNLDDARIAGIRRQILLSLGRDPENGKLDSENAAYIRKLVEQSVRSAQIGRSIISTADIAITTAKEAAAASTVWSTLTVVFDNVFGHANGDRMLKNAVRAGVISQSKYDMIRSIELLGFGVWKKAALASTYESWAARSLIISEGILSYEMIEVLRQLGVIDNVMALRLYPLVFATRAITRKTLENYMTSVRYRVVPGESPIKTYSRLTSRTDGEIMRLLTAAAQDTEKDIAKLAAKGDKGELRGAQQKMIRASIHKGMREMWEDVGSLTIFGERQAAHAAAAASSWMATEVYKAGSEEAANIMRGLEAQARAGIDAFISREENLKKLSRRVYKNADLAVGRVQREIQKGLIRGLSAKEMAANVASLIRPGVPGGVSYAAMRLARTEINNAFHFSQIRYTREMPWVEGYKWNLSGSHPKGQKGDPCADMASRNHDGIGRGVYKKRNVPGKPHPQCLCYLTNVTMPPGQFEKRLQSGAFDQYLRAAEKGNMGEDWKQARTVQDHSLDLLKDVSGTVLQGGGMVAVSMIVRSIAP